jgi:hypothetical protein
MMKNNYFKSLLFAAVWLLTSLTASAQFTAKVEQTPRSDWGFVPATFAINEVAEALGTDAATLLAALDSWMAEGSTDPNMFFYAAPSAPDTWSDGYTTGGEKGFWIGEDAEIIGYPDGAYYCNPVWDSEAGTFSINIGMMPDALKYGVYQKELKFALQYGGKTATFTIDFTVTGAEQVDIPEPAALKEVDLNIVGEAEVTVEQYPRGGYDADKVQIPVADILEKLGISANVLTNYMGELLYCTEFDTDNVGKRDSVTNKSTAGAPGFWVTDIRVNGEATGECSAAAYSGGCCFYMEAFAYDAENGVITCNVGQYPDKLKGLEQFFVNLYIIYGDKAYRIRVNFNCLYDEDAITLEDCIKVGEETITVENVPGGYNDTKILRPDLEAIAAALGCEVADITLAALSSEIDFGNSTANNGGFWFNIDGYVTQWANEGAVYFIEPFTTGDLTELKLGQYPDRMNVGDESTVSLYFMAGRKYYQYTVNFRIVEPAVIEGAFESIAQRSYVFNQEPSGYVWTEGIEIPVSFITETLGTSDYVVYGLSLLDEEGKELEGNDKYTKSYSITEAPGFWLDKDGRNSGWGDKSYIGITAGNGTTKGTFQMMQYPDRCQIGETYKTKLFFVNEATAKMITFNFTYNIVSEVVEYENVGTEDIILPVSMNEAKGTIDLSAAAEALGVSVDELLEGEYLCGMMESGLYTEGALSEDGLAFNKDGFFDQVTPAVSFNIYKDGDNVVVTAWSEEEIADDFRLSTQFCYQIDNKQYVFNVKFVSVAAYTGIANVRTADKTDGKIYDLSGREVRQPARGIYIQNGRKFIK